MVVKEDATLGFEVIEESVTNGWGLGAHTDFSCSAHPRHWCYDGEGDSLCIRDRWLRSPLPMGEGYHLKALSISLEGSELISSIIYFCI